MIEKSKIAWTGVVMTMALAPMLMGMRGGCGTTTDPGGDGGAPAEIPTMAGQWELTFNDDLSVEVDIGGAVYNPALGAGADSVTVEHDGEPIDYSVDCSRELVVCPSELLPSRITLTQRPGNPRAVSLEIMEQECRGEVVEGECMGTVITSRSTRNGSISADGSSFDIVLGGGVTAGGGCALLSISVARGDLVTSGSGAELSADEIMSGELITAFGGACLVAEGLDLDPGLEAAAVGASIQLRSTYSATRVR